jgi:IclR family pca regulon transcriptional regulator
LSGANIVSSGKSGEAEEFVRALSRGLAVIEAFDRDNAAMSLADVARRANVSRATARRLLHTLVELGYAASDGKRFSLRARVLNLGYSYMSSLGLIEVAQPMMSELAAEVRESCSASVMDGHDVIYVARVPSAQRIMSISLNIGSRLPAHCTSMGRVLLAGLADSSLEAFFAGAPFSRLTERTVTEPAALRAIVAKTAEQGWALVDGELEIGLISLAAPIRDSTGKVAAALNISSHSSRTSRETAERDLLPPLIRTAKAISWALGAERS